MTVEEVMEEYQLNRDDVLAALSYVVPNLDLFSARLAVAHAEAVPPMQLGLAALYAASYAAAVLALACLAFRSREFK